MKILRIAPAIAALALVCSSGVMADNSMHVRMGQTHRMHGRMMHRHMMHHHRMHGRMMRRHHMMHGRMRHGMMTHSHTMRPSM